MTKRKFYYELDDGGCLTEVRGQLYLKCITLWCSYCGNIAIYEIKAVPVYFHSHFTIWRHFYFWVICCCSY